MPPSYFCLGAAPWFSFGGHGRDSARPMATADESAVMSVDEEPKAESGTAKAPAATEPATSGASGSEPQAEDAGAAAVRDVIILGIPVCADARARARARAPRKRRDSKLRSVTRPLLRCHPAAHPICHRGSRHRTSHAAAPQVVQDKLSREPHRVPLERWRPRFRARSRQEV